MDNPSQIGSKELANLDEVKRVLIKNEIEAFVYQRGRDEGARLLIEKANMIGIFGMSYGATDERWWRAVDERMHSDEACLLVLFSLEYSKALMGSYSPVSRARVANRAVDCYLSARGNVDSAVGYRDRIIVADSKLLFPITSPLS